MAWLMKVLVVLPLAAAPSVPAWLSMFNPDFDAAGQHALVVGPLSGFTSFVSALRCVHAAGGRHGNHF